MYGGKRGVWHLARGTARRMSALEVATYGLLAAVALIFGYVEALFPLPLPVPGIKLGLGNIVVLFALAGFGWRAGLAIALVKVVVSALLFGNPMVLMYSAGGAALSFAAMWVALHWSRLSIVGVSMTGGVFHMVGQLAVVAFTFSLYVALVYLPVLLISGLVTGLLTGYVCRLVIRTTAKSNLFKSRARELARREGAVKAPAAREAMPATESTAKSASVCEAALVTKGAVRPPSVCGAALGTESTAKPAPVCEAVLATESAAESAAVCGAASDACEVAPAAKCADVSAPCAAPETDESNDQFETSESHV